MSSRRRPRSAGSGPAQPHSSAVDTRAADFWRPPPPLPELRPIQPSSDPSLLIRSLGDPPLGPKSVLAGHYLAAVLERAAGTAVALAVSADLLSNERDGDG